MSVLIKGMKMPKDGRRHKALAIFEPNGTCKIVTEYSESYSERHIKTFEAIELPPHGRLIDADALWDKGWFLTRDNIYKGQIEAAIITSAPAILEAEGDE